MTTNDQLAEARAWANCAESVLMMIEKLRSAEEEIKKERASRLLADDTLLKCQNNAIALMYEVKELKKDAERYRWLRAQNWDEANLFVVAGGKDSLQLGYYSPSLNLLDDEIDAAIASEKP